MKFDFKGVLKQCGVSILKNEMIVVDSKRPKIKYNRKLDSFVLYFPGPIGFGRQQYIFDEFDFNAAYYDSQYQDRQTISSRISFNENFLGDYWYDNEKLARIALVCFCFNLTPSLLKKCRVQHCVITLSPKKVHCIKANGFSDTRNLF